jgi:lantibiotic modifying enzyme
LHAKENIEFNNDGSRDPAALIFQKLKSYVLFSSSSGHERERAALSDTDLYDGSAGLAFYFAAYHRATRDPEARTLALLVFSRMRYDIGVVSAQSSMGALFGLGSILYALTQSADWLDEPKLLDSAQRIVSSITPELIRSDRSLDVMNGSAGTLLVLLSFAQQCEAFGINARPAKELAVICGQHLLQSRVTGAGGYRAWPTVGADSLPGFLHGTAGIAYALFRLYLQTGDDQFRDAAFEGFALERALFDPAQKTWRDPRSGEAMELGSSCEGAIGVALGRLGCIGFADVPSLKQDLEEALIIVRGLPESEGDQLCCGNFGKIDALYTAGDILGRLKLVDRALELSCRIAARSTREGFRFSPTHCEKVRQKGPNSDWALFPGLAGIGYVLLRLSHPGLFPAILLFNVQR